MSTDADELAKSIGGIKLRHIGLVTAGCCAFIATVGAGVAGYRQLGGPLPATQSYVADQVRVVSQSVEELARFAQQSRMIILSDKWWRIQDKLDEVNDALEEHPANPMLRGQQRRLKRDQDQVQRQIDELERR